MEAFTAPVIVALLAGVAALVTALGTAVASVIVAVRTSRKVDENTRITQTVASDVKVVEGHVNSAATASAMREAAYQKEVAALNQTVAELKQTAVLLAQAAVPRDPPPTAGG